MNILVKQQREQQNLLTQNNLTKEDTNQSFYRRTIGELNTNVVLGILFNLSNPSYLFIIQVLEEKEKLKKKQKALQKKEDVISGHLQVSQNPQNP